MEKQYYSNLRLDLVKLISIEKIENILEIGGGEFDTLKYVVNKYNCNGVGVDIRIPSDTDKIKFYQYDLDKIDNSFLNGQKFDLIIAGDVLEHTIYPEKVIEKLNSLLNNSGVFILSVPNIRSLRALYFIFIKGVFPRNDNGLFDRTHRSWFTYKNIEFILKSNNFEIVNYKPLGRLEKFFFGRKSFVSEFLALQHSFVVKRKKIV
jgi:SAM-dependent methyltransferase